MVSVAAPEASAAGSAFTAAQASGNWLMRSIRPDIELRVVSFPPTSSSAMAPMKRCSSMSPNEL